MRAASLVLVLVLATATADAQPSDDDKARQSQAREHYRRGMTRYNLGEFDAAIAEFKQAYELSHAPGLLFNLAQSHRLKRDYEQALYFYRTYLRVAPRAPNRADAASRVRELEKLVQERPKESSPEEPRTASAPAAPVDTPPPSAPVETPPTAAPVPLALPPAPPAPLPTPPSRIVSRSPSSRGTERPGRVLELTGVGLTVAGAALVATGIYFGVQSASAADQIGRLSASSGTWSAHYQQLYHDGQTDAAAATALYVVGGAAIGTGVVLALVGWRRVAAARTVAVAAGPGGLGLTLTSGF
jgi:tetratricopeptide (TPR) repeat protein